MRKVTLSRFLATSLIGLVSCSAVVWVSPSVLTQPANNSVATRYPSNSAAYMWPAQGDITQGFSATHEGVDIAGPSGTPIVAAASGEVTFAGWGDDGLGNSIELQHSDGSVTVYGHNKRLLVRKGQQVRQGQVIAEMGTTGNSTGSHLHFEIYPDGFQAADPFPRLPPLVSGKIPARQPVANTPEATAPKPTTPARVQPQPPLERNRQAARQSPIIARGTTGNNTAPPLDFEVYSEGRQTNKPNLVVPPVVLPETPRIQSEPVVPEPLNFAPPTSMSVGTGGICSDEAVIEGETANFLVNVCLENGRLFYLGQSKQNPNVTVRLPARSTRDGWYRADNGSYSYYVSSTQVKVLQNGRQIRSERLYKRG